MKKFIAMTLVLMLALAGFACAETLKMGTNAQFPPYEFYDDETGEIVGIDAEVAAAICAKLGYELEIVDMDFDALIPAVANGKIDMVLAGLTVTEERKQNVDFTTSYATGVQVIIVKEGSAITCADDLFAEGASHKIGVQQGTTGDLYSTWDLEDTGLASVERFKTGTDAVLALTAGKVDCVIIDNEPAKNYVAANEGLVILDTEYITEEYAIALAKGSELTEQINTALTELIADGTVPAIIEKYIPSVETAETEAAAE
jgi:polar amino acid transport system substrate-binding protein